MIEKYTPYEYVLISLANALGFDKKLWSERVQIGADLVNLTFDDQIKYMQAHGDEKMLGIKAIYAHRDMLNGAPTGFMCNLDATASGLQIMACLTGCRRSATLVNAVNTPEPSDVYHLFMTEMNKLGAKVDRETIKKPLMTAFYNSTAKPIEVLGYKTPAHNAFLKSLETEFTGPYQLLNLIRSLWNPEAESYTFNLPDGHTAHIPITDKVDVKIEIPEFNKRSFTYRTKVVKPKQQGRCMVANIVHGFDAYIADRVGERAADDGFDVLDIFDSFWAHPNHIQKVREWYSAELADIAKNDYLSPIIHQISNLTGAYPKLDPDMHLDVITSNYSLT